MAETTFDLQPQLITTSIPYPNANPHIGFALELVQADCLARFYRLVGHPVHLSTGLDEHGLKIQQAAEAAGMAPQDFVNQKAEVYRRLAAAVAVPYDSFVRTSEPDHQQLAQALWNACLQQGDIYKKQYRAWYNVKEEEFLGMADEVADPTQFGVDPQFVKLIDEENYFFALSRYTEPIRQALTDRTYWVVPDNRRLELLNFLDQRGLQDISISRQREKLNWGVPVPNDPDQVMYVWFDALTNYLTAAVRAEGNAANPEDAEERSAFDLQHVQHTPYWPAAIHCIGKDISRFHGLIWPGMLLSAGLPLPRTLFVHGFITAGGQKMSKSLGNVVDPFPLLEKYGTDAVRWFLLKEIPAADDGDFTDERFRQVYVADLANDWGNLVSRVWSMTAKYCGGVVPEEATEEQSFGLAEATAAAARQFRDGLVGESINFAASLAAVSAILEACNRLIDQEKPWVLVKDEAQVLRLRALLYSLLETIRQVTFLLQPIMPLSAATIRQRFFGPTDDRLWESWEGFIGWGRLPGGVR
jgi:methionyl-tRNA synthetase